MGNSSKKEKVEEEKEKPSSKSKEENNELDNEPKIIWFPVYNEFCFGDSPSDVNNKIPEQFGKVEWDTLPLAYEYKLDEVRYFFIQINKFDDLTKFIPPHIYVSPSSFVCFMFSKKQLFRISIRLIHDDRAQNYQNLVASYARAVNTPLLKDGMNVIPDGNVWNPYPSDKIEQKSSNLSNSEYLYDLMISYSHQDKDICHKIYYKLIEDGFKVWIDLENMYGSTIERMAEAIQNSQFIIICMSQKYQSSPYCKTEGQYTYKLQRAFIPLIVEKDYKPYGWLGALAGLRMYIDFTKYDFDIAYQKLIKEIQRNKLEQ